MEPVAHSARKKIGIAEQSYVHHISGVLAGTRRRAMEMLGYSSSGVPHLVEVVEAAARAHDLGKLSAENQRVLCTSERNKLPVNHVDAGTALLLRQGNIEGSLLIYSHHRGLCSIPEELVRDDRLFRDDKSFLRTNEELDVLLQEHERLTGDRISTTDLPPLHWSGLTRRLALSCLVDADHGDTSIHYGKEGILEPPLPRWGERLAALDVYVSRLPESQRSADRHEIYLKCRHRMPGEALLACDSPVGSGKTTAVMAGLLNMAIAHSPELRHIIVVLPYTNITRQSVQRYREALVLPGEKADMVVAEHDHQADFSDPDCRQLATLWDAPITVTTAVQFFETMANNQTARLRKLHQLPGSAVFIDEAHAAMPSWLWPQVWVWIQELVKEWGCHFVLASGSLARFWELKDFVNPPVKLSNLVDGAIRQTTIRQETRRIIFMPRQDPLDCKNLIDFVSNKPGPRLVILNTVQSAAVMADEICRSEKEVFHLSTALTPKDRQRVLERILDRLKDKSRPDWALVATSCVEAGMDFSFRTAFRESASAASLIQTGGRVNRHGEHDVAEVWDFRVSDPLFNHHPAFETSLFVLDEMFREGCWFNRVSASDLITEAMWRELRRAPNQKSEEIFRRERRCDYPEVAKLCRVIDADTRLVVVARSIIEALEAYEQVDSRALLANSVQLWSTKIRSLALEQIRGRPELYKWTGPYDSEFLGYMHGVLPLIRASHEGLVI